METTKIPAEKTAAEIASLLAKAGARKTLQDYDGKGRVVALSFTMSLNGQEAPFSLPVNADAVYQLLSKRRKRRHYRAKWEDMDKAQAERVAWRQVLKWVQAQVALIETNMVTATEVFLPYLKTPSGSTLYRELESGGFKALPLLTEENR